MLEFMVLCTVLNIKKTILQYYNETIQICLKNLNKAKQFHFSLFFCYILNVTLKVKYKYLKIYFSCEILKIMCFFYNFTHF